MKHIKIAILGMGTVGSGVYRVIEQEGAYITHKEGMVLEVARVLARNYSIPIPDEKKAASIDEVVNDPEIDIVVELMGGIHPAKEFITQALRAGKSVVSANKQLIANHWPELEMEAKKAGVGLYFEASVGGGIPLLRTVTDSLQANTMRSICAILNGTTNFILTKMALEGKDFAEVLAEAQALGYAEADPTADVEAFDSMYKLSILASMAFHVRLPIENIYCEGITHITKQDIVQAEKLGMCIKLLAIAKRRGELVQVRVHPTMIPKSHPLANVNDSFNAVLMNGSAVGDVMLYGRGAGDFPTASAVVSDVINASKTTEHRYMTFMNEQGKLSPTLEFETDWRSAYYVRLCVRHLPGTLAKITAAWAEQGVNLESVMQMGACEGGATVVFVTDEASELPVKRALERIAALDEVEEVASCIRVER